MEMFPAALVVVSSIHSEQEFTGPSDIRQMHTTEGFVNPIEHENTSGLGCVYRRCAGDSLSDTRLFV